MSSDIQRLLEFGRLTMVEIARPKKKQIFERVNRHSARRIRDVLESRPINDRANVGVTFVKRKSAI